MKPKPLILTVDRNRRNLGLLAQFLDKDGYQSFGATSIEEFEQALSRAAEIKLVLVDISGFDSQIWKLCEWLRDEQIPFLIISPRQSAAIEQESVTYGARSMLVKPLVVKELLRFIRSLLGE